MFQLKAETFHVIYEYYYFSKVSRSSVSAGEIRPIFEAESPDELALVDAAFAYNCKLIKRTPGQLMVSLPGDGEVEFKVRIYL